MKRMDLPPRHRAHGENRRQLITTPRGNANGYQNKGVARQESGGQAGKAIRTPRGSGQESMKTKGRQGGEIEDDMLESFAERRRYARVR